MMYRCPFCHREFSDNATFKAHVATHLKEPPKAPKPDKGNGKD